MKTNYDCERHGDRPNRFFYCCLAADAPENIKLVDYSGLQFGASVLVVLLLIIATVSLSVVVCRIKTKAAPKDGKNK